MSSQDVNPSYTLKCLFRFWAARPLIRLIGGSLLIAFVTLILFASAPPYPARAQTNDVLFSLEWSSTESDYTDSVAWGDYDSDGDLDLAVGNWNGPDRLYHNEGGMLIVSAVWSSVEVDHTSSVAWGDYDSDGDLDLAVGNLYEPNRLYRNDDGVLTGNAVWSSVETDYTLSVAWGDVDGDGDLDLAVGNGCEDRDPFNCYPNRLYHNESGILAGDAVWSSTEVDATTSIAWGDVDSDGDLDLVVGNENLQSNRLYRNEDGMLVTSSIWSSTETDYTDSVAWGDYDGDGDLDLAVGNRWQPNRLYRNDNGMLTPSAVWSSVEADYTRSVAWGDYDRDGDFDLAVGNYGPNRLYRNDGEILTASPVWSSTETDDTSSVAWGDYDGDGDLDLAVGNNSLNRLYRNDGALLTTGAFWLSNEIDQTLSTAWGDYDGDGDLDLAVGNGNIIGPGRPNRLYRNDGGVLTTSAVWLSDEADTTTSIAWGDYDDDGDLDLAVGNGFFSDQPNRLYRNEDGILTTTAVWSSVETDGTWSVAWGDYDSDGDLDLAVGNLYDPTRLYRNDDGVLTTNAVWSSSDNDGRSVAWGDYDGDGDLDLASGARLYQNEGGVLTVSPVWMSAEADDVTSIAWGDYDGDGDLDLAVGNASLQPNRLYRNEGGTLTTTGVWASVETDYTLSVAWGDYDGDGDLDLIVGNDASKPNRLYRNDSGVLTTSAVWMSVETDHTQRVAWGDVDGDGDLDLASASSDFPNRVYQNLRHGSVSLIDNPPYATIPRPGPTDDADFFSTPHIITTTNIPISYTLFDPEGDAVPKIFPKFSPNGGGQWFPATPGPGGDGLTELSASPEGTPHTFVWHAEADLIKSDNVVFRIRAQPGYSHGPILWPALDGKSPPFRVAAPWYIRVVNENGQVISGTTVYAAGQPLGVTGQGGLLRSGPLELGTPLATLVQQAEGATNRAGHGGWAYRTYITNVAVDEEGETHPFTVSGPGEQRLVVSPTNTLVLFNLLVSVEWDVTAAYLQDLSLAIEQAADFLYDVSDGQMTFGQVSIYDQAEHWAEADIQISAKNVVEPHAHIAGLTGDDPSHLIRVGRSWDGHTANQGAWSEPNGFKTLVHEFGHYGLGLYDEYFGYDLIGGDLAGQHAAFCTGPENREPETEASNGSVMDYHYTSSELVDAGRWTAWCRQTAQHQLNNGEADWQTLLRLYSDPSGQARWQLINPDQRAGVGQVVAGPNAIPGALPFPVVTPHNLGGDPPSTTLQVCQNGAVYGDGMWATLYLAEGEAMDQGLTDEAGQLEILGGRSGDTLRLVSLDGVLAASVPLPLTAPVDLSSPTLRALEPGTEPYLRLWPTTDGSGDLDGLKLVVSRTQPNDPLLYALTGPDNIGPSNAIFYDPAEGDHRVQVSFVPPAQAGFAKVLGAHAGQAVDLNVDFRLQRATTLSPTNLFSNDGNFKLHLEAGSLPLNAVQFLITSPWGLPGPLPAGLEIVGEAYEITASGNVTGLVKPAVLRLRYDPAVGSDLGELAIYRWDFQAEQWQQVGGEPDTELPAVVTPITELGLYALMGVPTEAVSARNQPGLADLCGPLPPSASQIYLPVVVKD